MSFSIEKLKEIEIEIFKSFIQICEANNLRYYLLGGTLLGAVRHQGFIPWDDDIDVGMPRQDYEIFLKIAQENLPKHLFVQTHSTDKENPLCYCKIRNSNTTFLESSCKNFKMNHGIFIDVFPLDNYPCDKKSQKKFIRKKKFYNRMLESKYITQNKSFSSKIKGFVLKCVAKFVSLEKIIQKRDAMYISQTNESIWANNGGAWGVKEICPASWYGEGVDLVFEGIKVKVPEKYELWLTQVYGDYMKLPPEEKRVTHHYTEVIDTEKSYTEYIK